MRPCANCGREFEPAPAAKPSHERRRARYCSATCRKEGLGRRAREWYATHLTVQATHQTVQRETMVLPPDDAPAELTPVTVEWDVSCLLHGTLTSYQWTVEYARIEQMAGRRRCAQCCQPVTISRALVTTAERVA